MCVSSSHWPVGVCHTNTGCEPVQVLSWTLPLTVPSYLAYLSTVRVQPQQEAAVAGRHELLNSSIYTADKTKVMS